MGKKDLRLAKGQAQGTAEAEDTRGQGGTVRKNIPSESGWIWVQSQLHQGLTVQPGACGIWPLSPSVHISRM